MTAAALTFEQAYEKLKNLAAADNVPDSEALQLLKTHGKAIIQKHGAWLFHKFKNNAVAAQDYVLANELRTHPHIYAYQNACPRFEELCVLKNELDAQQLARADALLTEYPSLMKRLVPVSADKVPALCAAAANGQPALARLLIQRGANLDDTFKGNTPLHFCAFSNDQEEKRCIKVARLLIENHIDMEAVNEGGQTALSLARSNNFPLLCRELLQQGAQLREPSVIHADIAQRLESYASDTCHYFKTHGLTKTSCFTGETLAGAVLDACATGQFDRLIAVPLTVSKTPEGRELFAAIWDKLPRHWREVYDASYVQFAAAGGAAKLVDVAQALKPDEGRGQA